MNIQYNQIKSYQVIETVKIHRSIFAYILALLFFWPAVILLVMFPKDLTIVQVNYLDGTVQNAKVSQTELGVIKLWSLANKG